MKKVKKLASTIIIITIMLMIYSLFHITLVSEAGVAGEKGELDLWKSNALWYDKFVYGNFESSSTGAISYYKEGKDIWFWRIYNEKDKVNLYGYDEQTLIHFNNVFCAQYDKVIACPALFANITVKVQIRGTTATFIKMDSMGNVIDSHTYKADINNVIGAILSNDTSGSSYVAYGNGGNLAGNPYGGVSYRYGNNPNTGKPYGPDYWRHTDENKALYTLWNEWITANGGAR